MPKGLGYRQEELLMIFHNNQGGWSFDQLIWNFYDANFSNRVTKRVKKSLSDLIRRGLVTRGEEGYTTTPDGVKLAQWITGGRRGVRPLLSIKRGSGRSPKNRPKRRMGVHFSFIPWLVGIDISPPKSDDSGVFMIVVVLICLIIFWFMTKRGSRNVGEEWADQRKDLF